MLPIRSPFLSRRLCTALFAALAPSGLPGQTFAADFDNGPGRWQTVVDGVMGGRSTARVGQTEPGVLSFTGRLSLENNGGFSQIRRSVEGRGFAGAEAIALEVRGDGRTYKLDLCASNVRRMASAWQQDFPTADGAWTTVRLPLDDFVLYSFGRRVRNAPELQAELIESLGVTLADKVEGPFRLDIRSVRAVGADAPAAARSGHGGGGGQGDSDLATVAREAGLTTLLDLVGRAELALPDEPVTIFAPTNEAFAKIPDATLRELLTSEGRDALRRILTFHIAPGTRGAADVLNARTVPTLSGQPLAVGEGRIGGAGLLAVDVPFDGGIVHVIDSVMLPEQRSIAAIASQTDQLSTLVSALEAAGLTGQFCNDNGPWTVFAPTNAAFETVPSFLLQPENRGQLTSILGVHVVPGRISARELLAKKSLTTLMGEPLAVSLESGQLALGRGVRIATADIQAANGVIHLIDGVLMPSQPAAEETTSDLDIVAAYEAVYEAAVDRGVPLFNGGSEAACAAVYEVAIESVLQLAGSRLDADVRDRLVRAQAAAAPQNDREKAWTLRRAMDFAYRRLQERAIAATPARGRLGTR